MNDMIETAKKILSTEKHLNPIALLFTGDSIHTVPLSYKTDAEKEKYLFATGIVAKQLQTDHIYLIFDAAMRLMTPEAIKNYDVTESPLSFPESMRTECIIIHSLDMKTETRETAIIPYKNDGKEIEFLPDLPKADHLDTWMPGAVLKGYKL
jgi:hypothetical protein